MKYFIIEGTIKNADLMNEEKMKEHISYTQKAMDQGLILISGLKENMSGGIFLMKAESIDLIYTYLLHEPFHACGIQEYKVIEFLPHYCNKSPGQWIHKD